MYNYLVLNLNLIRFNSNPVFDFRFGFAKKRINDIFEKFKVHVEEMDAFIGE